MTDARKEKKRIFISYYYGRREWIQQQLVPLLEAGGAEILVDFNETDGQERFPGQMDTVQKRADITLCILEPDYCINEYCMHELNHAVGLQSEHHTLIPVVRAKGSITACLGEFHAIERIDLSDPKSDTQWNHLLKVCDLELGMPVSTWLREHGENQ